jgi:hypothetical protein
MLQMSLAVLASTLAMTSVAHANCSESTIRGDYAFTVHGQALSTDGATTTGLIDGVGIISFDGGGNLTQEDFVVRNGTEVPGGATSPDGFHIGESGTYSVNDDCTGTANIVLGPGNTRTLALVISNSGRSIHAVTSAALVTGSPSLLQVHADYEKINAR